MPTVDGEEEVEVKPGTQPEAEIRLRGKGAPHLRRPGSRGDLHVMIEVEVPTKLTEEAARAARAVRGRVRRQRGVGQGRHPRQARPGVRPPRRQAPPAGAWLELAVEADPEAVEAVSEILGRVATGGTTVEPAFELVDEGLGARIDLSRPAVVRAYLPARDGSAAEVAAAEVAEALGHLQAFGLRPIGELRTRAVHEADWADAWKAIFPVMRIGRRLVIQPTWRRHAAAPDDVLLALDPGWPSGPGCTRRRACASRVSSRWQMTAGCGMPAFWTSAAAPGILAIAALKLGGSTALGVDTDPIAIEATTANARRNRLGGPADRTRGVAADRCWAVRRRPRQPDRGRAHPPGAAAPSDRAAAGRDPARVRDLRRP